MIIIWKRAIWRFTLALSALWVIVVLAACSSSSSVASKPAPPKLFKGTGFTISYPSNWHQQADGDQATFADAISRNLMAIFTDANPGKTSAATIANQAWANFMKTLLVDPQPVSVSPTYSLAGIDWVQLSATGVLTSDPGVQGNFFLLVANYPNQGSSVNSYEIEYYGPSATFDQANQEFATMLQSFQFTPASS